MRGWRSDDAHQRYSRLLPKRHLRFTSINSSLIRILLSQSLLKFPLIYAPFSIIFFTFQLSIEYNFTSTMSEVIVKFIFIVDVIDCLIVSNYNCYKVDFLHDVRYITSAI